MGSTTGTATATAGVFPPGCLKTTVEKLMEYCQDKDVEFNQRAILSLLKKLRDKPDEWDELVAAITSNGVNVTKCVTIPRTLDGRLQVAGRKLFPHVIFARMWRWPDIHKNQMKHVPGCQFAYDLLKLKLDCVCVNPYHYERVVSVVSASHGGSSVQQLSQDGDSHEPSTSAHPAESSAHPAESSAHPAEPVELPECASPTRSRSSSIISIVSSTSDSESDEHPTSSAPDIQIQRPVPMYDHSPHAQSSQAVMFPHAPSNHAILPLSPQILFAPNYTMGLVAPPLPVAYWQMQNQLALAQFMRPTLMHFQPPQQQTWEDVTFRNAVQAQPMPEFWCTIAYFELHRHVGEVFKVRSADITVYVDGSSDRGQHNRFCLGPLTNVFRLSAVDAARRQIGRGIRVESKPDGSVWLRCLSDYSVFVESCYLDREAGRSPGDAVHKVYPQAPQLKVFDLRQCYCQMLQQMQLLPKPLGSVDVGNLRRFCVLRLSFGHVWGPEFLLKTIEETPCWIEIHFHCAMQLLEEVSKTVPSSVIPGV